MAKTITREDMVYASFPIEKMTETDDGDLIIYGKATDGTVDSDRQIVDSAWSGPALEKWLRTKGNIRVQHSPHLYPAGKGMSVEVDRDGDGAHWVKARIVEDNAKKLVKARVLQDFSVGISHPLVIRDVTGKAKNGIITGNDDTEIAELSICDRGSNHNSGFVLAKSASSDDPWTFGDVQRLVAEVDAAEAVVKAKKKAAAPAVPDASTADGAAGDDAADDAPDPDDDDADDDSQKAYAQAVALYKAAEPQRDLVAPTGTEFLQKAAAWRKWDAHGDELGLDGTSVGYETWLAKRDMDPDVGGGVDRDQIPDADHVDSSGRRFPIVRPGDVSDAVSSYGRAKPLIPMRKFRRRLTAIAHRKGPAFAAQLPDSWSKTDGADVVKDITLTDPNTTGLVPYNLAGAKPPKKRKRDMAQPDVAKGGKDCPNCGKDYDADSKMRVCEGCGGKLPKAKVEKSKGDRMVPADVKPAGKHTEPDGSAVEALEHDAGMPTTPDAKPDDVPASVKADMPDDATAKPKKGKKKPAFPGAAPPFGSKSATPYQVQRMHDATCAAHGWDSVVGEYPALKSVADAVVSAWFTEQVADAANKGNMAAVAALAPLAQEADVVAKGLVDPAVMADARAMLHKSFTDMYPTVTLKPGAPPQPGQFQRPYITAGHAPLSAGSGTRPSAVPPSTHVPSPDQFNRPLITAGHEAESPSDKSNNLATSSVASGSARSYYTNASKEAARNAMQAMHDHIAATFPDMCAMAPSRNVMPPDNGATNVPKAIRPLDVPPAPGGKTTVSELKKLVKRAEKAASAINDRPDVDLDDVIAKAIAATDAKHQKAAKKQHKLITALQEENDRLGAQPDPAQAPLRGVVSKAATVDKPAPIEKVSLLEKARAAHEQEQAEYVRHLQKMAGSDNPDMAQKAERALAEVLTAT